MGKHLDIGYFKKPVKVRGKVAKERTVINKIKAWQLGKDYYDGNRLNGYGGFKYDGRWQKMLPKIIKRYKLNNKSRVLDLGCKKGFLINDLRKLIPGITCYGVEDHEYPIKNCKKEVRKYLKYSNFTNLPFRNNSFDCILALSSIYTYNFGDLVKILGEINSEN